MANKYHRKGFRSAGIVLSQLAKKKGKTDFEKFFENVYTKDKTGNKDRMINALNISFKNFSPIVVIGSDLWELEISDIMDAFGILKKKNIVIGPSTDGGYYLIGMNYLDTKIFENKNWGQQSVLNETIRDIDDITNIHLLDEKTDIDTYDDLCQFPDLKIKL